MMTRMMVEQLRNAAQSAIEASTRLNPTGISFSVPQVVDVYLDSEAGWVAAARDIGGTLLNVRFTISEGQVSLVEERPTVGSMDAVHAFGLLFNSHPVPPAEVTGEPNLPQKKKCKDSDAGCKQDEINLSVSKDTRVFVSNSDALKNGDCGGHPFRGNQHATQGVTNEEMKGVKHGREAKKMSEQHGARWEQGEDDEKIAIGSLDKHEAIKESARQMGYGHIKTTWRGDGAAMHFKKQSSEKESSSSLRNLCLLGPQAMPLLNRAVTVGADGKEMLNFSSPPDGWYQLAPYGEFAHPTGLSQVIDREGAEKMIGNMREQSKQANWGGVRVDFDHASYDVDKPSRAAAWITDLAAREDGLWAKMELTNSGKEAIEGGDYRFISPVWLRDECEDLGNNRVRPTRLDSAGVTNNPNIVGSKPLSV